METQRKRINRKVLVIIIIVVFVGISLQFTGPEIVNPPITSEIQVPENVSAILRKACYDCHSNESRPSWFDKIAPVSWLVSSDIKQARSRFNFSQWNDLAPADQQVKFWEMINMAQNNKMPLPSYVTFHPDAKLTKTDIDVLKKYGQQFILSKPGDTAGVKEAEKELAIFMALGNRPQLEPVSLNGIKYSGDYKNWKVMVATTRFETRTMRVVYGNDIAIRAIEEGNINPWPQGSTIVKVVWNMIEDADGNIRPGTFNNTQWMVKDDQKFQDTKGWGFARFNGTNLLPYGKNAAFGTECFNCHKLVKETGYVFDLPVSKKNQLASTK
ncbi:heme-binding domain-containing protein [Pedobacter jamesrossensis]|uniref:Heme-binding domain-containing protein n=1 Tax=Pedobacter jamesrossensis TaxID=1908238 RepID=A0ABV8NL20_9SPHI